jgi:hypothetical protein
MAGKEKKEVSPCLTIGNYSSNVNNAPENKDDFVKMYKGKLNRDLNSVWKAITKRRAELKKTNKGSKAEVKAEETTNAGGDK